MGKGKNEKKLVVNDNFVIDEDDLCEAIANQLALDEDTVFEILDSEMHFFETKGLVIEEKSPTQGAGKIGLNQPHPKEMQVADGTNVDVQEVVDYVATQTGLASQIVRNVIEAEALLLGGNV